MVLRLMLIVLLMLLLAIGDAAVFAYAYDDDDYHNSVPERYRSVFFLHNWVDMPKELCPMFLAFDIMTKKWVKNCTGA